MVTKHEWTRTESKLPCFGMTQTVPVSLGTLKCDGSMASRWIWEPEGSNNGGRWLKTERYRRQFFNRASPENGRQPGEVKSKFLSERHKSTLAPFSFELEMHIKNIKRKQIFLCKLYEIDNAWMRTCHECPLWQI